MGRKLKSNPLGNDIGFIGILKLVYPGFIDSKISDLTLSERAATSGQITGHET